MDRVRLNKTTRLRFLQHVTTNNQYPLLIVEKKPSGILKDKTKPALQKNVTFNDACDIVEFDVVNKRHSWACPMPNVAINFKLNDSALVGTIKISQNSFQLPTGKSKSGCKKTSL